MRFQDFNVYDDNGNLIETLPAILYIEDGSVIAEVPAGTVSVNFIQVSNGQSISITASNGKAIFNPSVDDTYRVGSPTISKRNEISALGVSLQNTKNSKISQLQQSYFASFTTFQSSALGVTKTYPINEEAQTNLEQLERRLIADANKNSFYFKTIEDGTLVNHTRAQFLQLLTDAETFKVNQTTHYNSLCNQVNTTTTKDGVDAIVW